MIALSSLTQGVKMFASIMLFLTALVSGDHLATYAVVNPCPEIVVVGNTATIVCDDGAATFNLTAMEPGETYHPHVMAGSHTVRAIILVEVGDTNELRAWVDDPVSTGGGRLTSKVTIVDIDSGEVTVLPK